MNYKFTETEINKLLKSIVVLVDTREKVNSHITEYWDKYGIQYESMKLDHGDYSAKIPACEELGIARDLYFPVSIERKNSVDELVQTIKDRTRFENELLRSKGSDFLLMVEDLQGYSNILNGNYRSQYEPKALLGSLKSFEAKYQFNTVFVAKELSAHYIYYHLYYKIRNQLKG